MEQQCDDYFYNNNFYWISVLLFIFGLFQYLTNNYSNIYEWLLYIFACYGFLFFSLYFIFFISQMFRSNNYDFFQFWKVKSERLLFKDYLIPCFYYMAIFSYLLIGIILSIRILFETQFCIKTGIHIRFLLLFVLFPCIFYSVFDSSNLDV